MAYIPGTGQPVMYAQQSAPLHYQMVPQLQNMGLQTSSGSDGLNLVTADGRRVGDVISLQEQHFGRPHKSFDNDVGALMARVNKVLPDDWYGRDSNIRVEELLIQSVMQDQTKLLEWLPWARNPHGTAFKFKKVIFNQHLPDPIPEQGVARVLTQSYEEWSASMERYGLAFQMEDGFRMTASGIRDYNCHIVQIQTAFITLAYIEILGTLYLEALAAFNSYDSRGLTYPGSVGRTLRDNECKYWSICTKSANASKEIMKYIQNGFANRNGVKPDGIIVPFGTLGMFKDNDYANWDYNQNGPKADAYRVGRPDTWHRDVNGFVEMESGLYPCGPDEQARDITTRPQYRVEYHVTRDNDYPIARIEEQIEAEGKLSGVTILDMRIDAMRHIPSLSMLRFCPLFKEDGSLRKEGLDFLKRTDTARKSLQLKWRGGEIETFRDYLQFNDIYDKLCRGVSIALNRTGADVTRQHSRGFLQLFGGLGAVADAVVDGTPGATGSHHEAFGQENGSSNTQRVAALLRELLQAGANQLSASDKAIVKTIKQLPGMTDDAAQELKTPTSVPSSPELIEVINRLPSVYNTAKYPGKHAFCLRLKARLQGPISSQSDRDVLLSPAEVGGIFSTFPLENLTRDHLEWFLERGIPCGLDFVCVRMPCDEMGSLLAGKRGSQTGHLFVGDPNFQMNHIGQQKMLYGFAHMYLGAMVSRPENLLRLDNFRTMRHLHGGSVEFMNPNDPDVTNSYLAHNGENARDADIWVIPKLPGEVFPTECILGANPIASAEDDGSFVYAGAELMQAVWGWTDPGQDRPTGKGSYYAPASKMPRWARQACTYFPGLDGGSINLMRGRELGKGHIEMTYDGCIRDITGNGKHLQAESPALVGAKFIDIPQVVSS